jgi:hypothetical protein
MGLALWRRLESNSYLSEHGFNVRLDPGIAFNSPLRSWIVFQAVNVYSESFFVLSYPTE